MLSTNCPGGVCQLAREITTHRIGRGDNELVTIEALQPGTYRLSVPKSDPSKAEPLDQTYIVFKDTGVSGLTDEALLAVLLDRMRAKEGTNGRVQQAAFHIEDALNVLRT